MSVQSVPKDESSDEQESEMTEEERLLASIPEEYRDELASEIEEPASPEEPTTPEVESESEPEPVDEGSDEPELDAEDEDVGEDHDEGEGEDKAEAEVETETEGETEVDSEDVAEEETDEENETESETSQTPHGRNLPLRSGSASLPAKIYDSFISNMTTFHSDGRLVFSESGINMSAPDKSNVAMTDATLNREAFESFAAPETELGINLKKTEDALGVFDSDSEITLTHDEETHMQTIGDSNLEFDFGLVDLAYIDTPADIPDFVYSVSFTLATAEFKRLIKAANMVGDTMMFTADEDSQTVTLSAEGDTDEVDKAFGPEEIDIDSISDGVSRYSLDYLKPIQKTMKGTDEIEISFTENYPLRISFEQHDEALETEFLIAPKIPSDS